MKNYKVLKEHPKYFEVCDSRDGKTFKVAKKGLEKKSVEKIQRFADGGTVLPEEFAGDTVPGPAGIPDAGVIAPVGLAALDPALKAVLEGPLLSDNLEERRAAHDAAFARVDANAAQKKFEENAARVAADEKEAADTQAKLDAQAKADADYKAQVIGAVSNSASASAPVLIKANAPAFPALSASPSTSGIDSATAAQAAAVKAAADVQLQKAKEAEVIQAGLAQQQREEQDRFQKNLSVQQAISAGLGVATALQRVNPDRFWQSRSNSQKMSAGAAMVLGGAARGTLGGQNSAVALIETAIDRDVRAQQDNIKQFDGLYKKHLDLMGSQAAAYAQTKADLLTVAQTRINQLAAKHAGPEAKANAQLAVADLEKKKEEALFNVAAQQTQRQDQHAINKANYGMQNAQLGLQRQQLQMSARSAAAGGGVDASKVAALAASGREVPGELSNFLPKELADKSFTVRSGFVRLAMSKELAAQANDAGSRFERLKEATDRLKQLGREASLLPTEKQKEYMTARTDIIAQELKAISGATVSEKERENFEKNFPDASSFVNQFFEGRVNAGLTALVGNAKMGWEAAKKAALPGGK